MLELVIEKTAFLEDVITGLSHSPKFIPSRYFYDRKGSELFERITALAEYYPTHSETALLKEHSEEIARFTGKGRTIVEFGSGSSVKTPIILDATRAATYVPIDISSEFLAASASAISEGYPELNVIPVAGDFARPMTLPKMDGPLTGFFPGSTIGNFHPAAATDLLRSFRATLGKDSWLVIGLDTRKHQGKLEAAYDDAEGVTAAFNLNLLHRINRELDTSVPVDSFEHRAVWNNKKGRIEMHLVAQDNVHFNIAGHNFSLVRGESIHTENSYKYTIDEARMLARSSGWEPMAYWTDAEEMFGVHVWRASGVGGEP